MKSEEKMFYKMNLIFLNPTKKICIEIQKVVVITDIYLH